MGEDDLSKNERNRNVIVARSLISGQVATLFSRHCVRLVASAKIIVKIQNASSQGGIDVNLARPRQRLGRRSNVLAKHRGGRLSLSLFRTWLFLLLLLITRNVFQRRGAQYKAMHEECSETS